RALPYTTLFRSFSVAAVLLDVGVVGVDLLGCGSEDAVLVNVEIAGAPPAVLYLFDFAIVSKNDVGGDQLLDVFPKMPPGDTTGIRLSTDVGPHIVPVTTAILMKEAAERADPVVKFFVDLHSHRLTDGFILIRKLVPARVFEDFAITVDSCAVDDQFLVVLTHNGSLG